MKNKIAFENLRTEMARKNISIGELAEKIGRDRSTLSQKLSQKHATTLTEAISISMALDKPVELLFAELYERE